MNLLERIQEIEKIQGSDANKVFTMYLNTDPSDPDQQGGKWKIHLKNGLHNFERYLQEDENKEELKQFQNIKKKVERYIFDHEQHLKRSVVIFATADEEIWFAERLQIRVKSEFYWEASPVLDQLDALVKEYPKAGIILAQHDVVKVIETSLNEVGENFSYELDLDTEDWKEKVGPRKGFHSSGLGSRNAQIDNFKARFEANKHRWYKDVAAKLDKQAKDCGWEKIYIVGEKDVSHELDVAMNKKVDEIVHKNMVDQETSKVIHAIFG